MHHRSRVEQPTSHSLCARPNERIFTAAQQTGDVRVSRDQDALLARRALTLARVMRGGGTRPRRGHYHQTVP